VATHSIRQFPLHFPSRCATMCHHISTGVYVTKFDLWKKDTIVLRVKLKKNPSLF